MSKGLFKKANSEVYPVSANKNLEADLRNLHHSKLLKLPSYTPLGLWVTYSNPAPPYFTDEETEAMRG